MQLEEFEILTRAEKEEVLWKFGQFLITYHDGSEIFDAYELFDFYAASCLKKSERMNIEIISCVYPDDLPNVSKIENLEY